jgi:hypothetical protein
MASQFLPGDAVAAIEDLLQGLTLGDGTPLNIGSIGELEINDDDELVFDQPMVRTRYAGSPVYKSDENQQLNYQDVQHVIELWCYVENLRGKTEQRQDSVDLAGLVLARMAGARLPLSDGSSSEPVRIWRVTDFIAIPFGMVYIVHVVVPGIAQFPGAKES